MADEFELNILQYAALRANQALAVRLIPASGAA